MARRAPSAAGLPAFFALNPRAISFAEGLRAALSVAVIVLLDAWLNRPELLGAALAAWLTCLGDGGGAIRKRVPVLLTFVLLGAFLTGAFGLLRTLPAPIVVPIASVCIFCTSFARVWGQSQMQAGNLLSIAIVLALRTPLPTFGDAAEPVAMFLAGGLWAVLVTMVIWRVHPYLPARQAVADCFDALASLTGDLAALAAAPARDDARWDRHVRAHRRAVRDALEKARGVVFEAVRARGQVSGRARESWIRLETADQIFGAMIGLSELLEYGAGEETRARAARMLRLLRPVLLLLGEYVVSGAPSRLERLDRTVAGVEALAEAGSPLRPIILRITDRVRIAITLAAADGQVAGFASDPPIPLRERVLGPIRANLTFKSAILRHALRVTAASFVAFAITLTWPGSYEHWLTITLLLTMQPFFAVTFTRAVERIGGTVLGGALAAALLYFVTTPLMLAIVLFPLVMVALSMRAVSFGLFIVCITPAVVLLSEVAHSPDSELTLALMRAIYTLAGGALALVASFVLWPSWEPDRLARELRGAIVAHGRYALAEISTLLGEGPASEVERCRRAAGLASNNVETSLQRTMLEPHGDHRDLEAALTVDAALRRMAGRLSVLQVDPGKGHDPAAWHAWRDWIETATGKLGELKTDLPPRPPLPANDRQADALLRIARQLELSAAALARVPV
jgi:uncharacterized membrane protein YccC